MVAPASGPSVGVAGREVDLIRPDPGPLDDRPGQLGVDQEEVGRQDGDGFGSGLDRQGPGVTAGCQPRRTGSGPGR